MIKTPLSIALGGAFWTPGATVIGGNTPTFDQQIQKLFANDEQGFFYDPNDLSTMFQDAVGTVPVTGAGQPVGLIRDKSGRNNHAYQTTSASRPILRQNAETGANYLEFDGSDDFLQTNNIDFTATDKVSLFAGVRKLSDAVTGMLTELSINSGANNGSFRITAPALSGLPNYGLFNRGTLEVGVTASGYMSPISSVISGSSTISADALKLRINGAQVVSSSVDQGTGNYGSYPLYIGRRGGISLPFGGHICGLIGVGKLTSGDETAAIEKELAKRVGVTLNV